MSDFTQILEQASQGDAGAAARLLELVYDDLRKLAAARLAQERPGQTLQATALVHEAYLRLAPGAASVAWQNRGHFFAAAAEAMRRILIDQARRKGTRKRGGDCRRVDLDVACSVAEAAPDVDLLALDEALLRLAAEAPPKAELVKLRYFAGLTLREAAETMGISLATAERHWAYARSWLYCELDDREAYRSGEKKSRSS